MYKERKMDVKNRIVYIKPNNTSFVKGDETILKKHYNVRSVLLYQSKGNFYYSLSMAKMFCVLLLNSFRKNTVFICWFADYHAAIMTFAAKLTRKKSIIFIGGQEAINYPELEKGVYRKKIRAAFVGYSLRNTDLIIANHQSLIYHQNYYYNPEHPHIDGIKHYVSNLKTPVEIIYNGIDPEKFVRDYSVKKEENLILTVGTMSQIGDFYNKGFDLFIQTAQRMPDLRFILIGLNSNFLAWIEENYHFSNIPNLTIIPSFCPQNILNESYNKAKVFVQASITEGMPNTLSEAMLMGCIPVGSNVNGIPDAIGETGVIVSERSVDALERGLLKALEMDTSLAARDRVIKYFSIDERDKKIEKSVDSLLR